MTLLDSLQQKQISQQVRLPVNDTTSSKVVAIAGESPTFYYYATGVLTADAGEAAGTAVVVPLLYGNVRNAVGDMIGTHNDTSVVWGIGTTLVTLKPFPYLEAEQYSGDTGADKLNAIVAGFGNGDYCIDHETGTVYGLKADAGFIDTVNYNIEQGVSAGATAGDVNISQVGGNAVVEGGQNGVIGVGGGTSDGGLNAGFNNPVTAGLQTADFDGAALPSVAIGDGSNTFIQGSVQGVQYTMPVNEDGSVSPVDQTDGSMLTKPKTVSNDVSIALEASAVVKAAAGTLYELRVTNTGAAQYIQIHDAAAVPADTAIPAETYYFPGTTTSAITFPQGRAFSNGISLSNSSTAATKTIGAADCWFSADYE